MMEQSRQALVTFALSFSQRFPPRQIKDIVHQYIFHCTSNGSGMFWSQFVAMIFSGYEDNYIAGDEDNYSAVDEDDKYSVDWLTQWEAAQSPVQGRPTHSPPGNHHHHLCRQASSSSSS